MEQKLTVGELYTKVNELVCRYGSKLCTSGMPSAEALDAIATCIEEMAERNRDLVLEVNRLNERLESFEVK